MSWRKWAGIAIGGGLGVLSAGAAAIYIISNTVIYRTYTFPATSFHAPVVPDAISRGEHLTQISGCIDCHKLDLTGALFDDTPGVRIWSRNLRLAARTFSDADFDRAIRHGLHADGTSLFIMPSDCFAAMRDDELASMIAYLRGLPPLGVEHSAVNFNLVGRIGVLRGFLKPSRAWFDTDKPPLDAGPATASGRHLAQIACAECHDSTLNGATDDPALQVPNLVIAGSYSREEFLLFMRTGKAAGGRELPVMSATAQRRFAHFTDAEIDDLYDYLVARASKLVDGGT